MSAHGETVLPPGYLPLFGALVCAPGLAWAQDTGLPSDADEPGDVAPASRPLPTDDPVDETGTSSVADAAASRSRFATGYRDGFAWQPDGPLRFADVADIVIAADDGVRAVVTSRGAVWVRSVVTRRWERAFEPYEEALGGLSRDESIRLSSEARLEELLEDSRGAVNTEDLEQGASAGDGFADDVGGELTADEQSDPLLAFELSSAGGFRPRLWLDGAALVVARRDGTFESTDGGVSWTRLADTSAAWLTSVDGLRLRGAGDGVHWLEGDTWRAADVPTRAVVWQLVETSDGVFAATEDGLWRSQSGREWVRVGTERQPLLALQLGPAGSRVIWAATTTSVLRSDNLGESWRAPLGSPVSGVRDLLLQDDGLLLAAGKSGVWESADGGSAWYQLSKGLFSSYSSALAYSAEEGPWVASSDGTYVLAEVNEEQVTKPVEPWIKVSDLLAAAATRGGMEPGRESLGSAGQVLAYFLPQLRLEFSHRTDRSTSSQLDAGITRRLEQQSGIWLRFTWETPSADLASMGVFVIDDEDEMGVYSGVLENRVLMGRVSRRLSKDRSRTADQITDMFYNRQQLVRERAQARDGRTLLEAVHLDLRIAEVEALLDVLTDGAVSRYRDELRVLGGGG